MKEGRGNRKRDGETVANLGIIDAITYFGSKARIRAVEIRRWRGRELKIVSRIAKSFYDGELEKRG